MAKKDPPTGPNGPDAALARIGISIEPLPGGSGGRFAVKGDTYPHRQVLQDLGGQWHKLERHWVFEVENPAERLAAALPIPAAEAAEKPNRPHYWGHRERLRRRAQEGGFGALPDYELLELLLFATIERKDVKPLAKGLLERFGSLGGVLAAREEELGGFDLVKFSTIVNLRAIAEAAARLGREELKERPILNSIDKVAKHCRTIIGNSAVEQFRVLFLDQRHGLIADELQQTGTVNEVAAYPRQILQRALNLGAVGLVLVHNHPSGNLKPSTGDIEITREIMRAAEPLGVALHDHLIVGPGGHISLRQTGKLPR
jgi:DNA repair protein RadC